MSGIHQETIADFEPTWLEIQSHAVATCPMWHDMQYITAVTETEYKSEYQPTKYIPYLALLGELWDVFCKDFEEN